MQITRMQVSKNFEIRNLGEHQDLYVQSDALLLADLFESFAKDLRYNLNLSLETPRIL